jgi:hypothetical protein
MGVGDLFNGAPPSRVVVSLLLIGFFQEQGQGVCVVMDPRGPIKVITVLGTGMVKGGGAFG